MVQMQRNRHKDLINTFCDESDPNGDLFKEYDLDTSLSDYQTDLKKSIKMINNYTIIS